MEFYFPPESFSLIEEGLYRSNTLQPQNFAFIKRLGLKTVVRLSPEEPSQQLQTFYKSNDIKLIPLGAQTWQETNALESTWKRVSDELVKEALELILDRNNYPIMLVCTSGIHQTGTVVACLRRLQHWSLSSALMEFRAATTTTKYANEQFVELFDLDLVNIPDESKLPDWFLLQERMFIDDRS